MSLAFTSGRTCTRRIWNLVLRYCDILLILAASTDGSDNHHRVGFVRGPGSTRYPTELKGGPHLTGLPFEVCHCSPERNVPSSSITAAVMIPSVHEFTASHRRFVVRTLWSLYRTNREDTSITYVDYDNPCPKRFCQAKNVLLETTRDPYGYQLTHL